MPSCMARQANKQYCVSHSQNGLLVLAHMFLEIRMHEGAVKTHDTVREIGIATPSWTAGLRQP